jgi:hypothetical protein
MGIFRRSDREPDPLDGADLGLDPGERVLASCTDTVTGDHLVAATFSLLVVDPAGSVTLHRPWHLVDTGSYDNEADVLHVSWVDRAPDLALHVGAHRLFLMAFRERVQASVVLAETVAIDDRRSARVVIRKELARERLLDQVILGRGVRLADPGVRPRIQAARQQLREQVGLP